jgi:pimeloyl-ACP methyl ester carboxylesterase
MLVDLVRAQAADGLRLDGALLSSGEAPTPAALDAVVCLHGVASNFYGSTIFEPLATALGPLGIALLWANTRGHDGFFTASIGGRRRRLGSAYELVDECRHDITGWIEFLVKRGHQRIGLLGHSLGAIKALYSQAHQPHAAVQAVIAISPARLSHAAFKNGPDSSLYFEAASAAEAEVQAGRPEALIEVKFPFPMLITAGGYLDKYGPAERYNILGFGARVACPTLFVFGDRELTQGGVAFAGLPEAIHALPPTGQQFELVTVPDADHIYTGTADTLARTVADWVIRLEPRL